MKTAEIIYWLSFAGLIYVYAGYPAWVWIFAKLFPVPVKKAPFRGSCSVVISAHNEERRIAEKLQNVLRSGPAGERINIWVGCDGCTDRTAEQARAVQDERVQVVEFVRGGKPSVLNALIPRCESDVVVLMDVRQELDPAALGNLLENFADERVGVVSGELVFRRHSISTPAAGGVDAYWRYEKFIRRNESLSGSVPGATGALYAIRRKLFQPIPPNTILDDVAIPMNAMAAGARCVFESRAVAYDAPSASYEAESVRKRRTLAGNLQLCRLYPAYCWRHPLACRFISHKILRLFSPFLLISLFAANGAAAVSGSVFYPLSFVLLAAFAGLGLASWLSGIRVGIFSSVCSGFLALNAAALQAWFDAAAGRYSAVWEKNKS
jgi:cellulose synthase/poly-beta-1,6-N-acetylglucosamine synthase-like glycosyltransferase